jgi:transcriptional regulator with XRE-family HTH domain
MQENNSRAVIQLMGERLKAYRIDYQMTQKELADRSGVSVRSIQNFEHGEDIQLSSLIKITKTLGLDGNLSMLVPDVSKRPSMYLEKTKKKMRVRKKVRPENDVFKWGDEV